jgi:hypothetical protein
MSTTGKGNDLSATLKNLCLCDDQAWGGGMRQVGDVIFDLLPIVMRFYPMFLIFSKPSFSLHILAS